MEYKWFEIIKESTELNQGDLLPNCPIIIPPKELTEGSELEVTVNLIDSIILSQSCDLVNDKSELVLVCPYYPLSTYLELLGEQAKSKKGREKSIENLRKGHVHAIHLINKDKMLGDYCVVDFRNVYGVHFNTLQNLAFSLKERLRLLPPYREHLSQSFARYFMRVGLPQDLKIPEDY